jgi:uncharacterized protein
MGTLRDDLREGAELIETHVSWVFRHPRDVYKVKRPVNLGFLDFRTPGQRRAACEAEVELNRRLAPDVYLGVVPVTRDAAGRHRLGGDGEPVDWAVHMVRLDDDRRADRRLAAGTLLAADIDAIAARIAAFHAAARADAGTARFGTPQRIGANVRENFEQTRDSVLRYVSRAEAAEIEAAQLGFLVRHADRLEARCAAGRVRDGHGDLRLEHVYLRDDGPPLVIDCIEFNERFRYGDVCADLAFLSMDLAWHGRSDLAERLLASYARDADDYGLYGLVDFYEGYRAYVRGKVASLLAADPSVEHDTRARAGREARRYYLLALAARRRPLLPAALVAVGGLIASGKSTIAAALAQELAAPVVATDVVRKRLAGVAPRTPLRHGPWQGAYAPEATRAVYRGVLDRARAVLDSGRPAVLDGSFRARDDREAARALAREAGVPFVFVECRAPAEVCRQRLRERARHPGVSDGRLELQDDFAAAWEPVGEDENGATHLVLDTSRPLEDSVARLTGALAAWPPGLTG